MVSLNEARFHHLFGWVSVGVTLGLFLEAMDRRDFVMALLYAVASMLAAFLIVVSLVRMEEAA